MRYFRLYFFIWHDAIMTSRHQHDGSQKLVMWICSTKSWSKKVGVKRKCSWFRLRPLQTFQKHLCTSRQLIFLKQRSIDLIFVLTNIHFRKFIKNLRAARFTRPLQCNISMYSRALIATPTYQFYPDLYNGKRKTPQQPQRRHQKSSRRIYGGEVPPISQTPVQRGRM